MDVIMNCKICNYQCFEEQLLSTFLRGIENSKFTGLVINFGNYLCASCKLHFGVVADRNEDPFNYSLIGRSK